MEAAGTSLGSHLQTPDTLRVIDTCFILILTTEWLIHLTTTSHNTPMTHPWHTHDTPMTHPWHTHDTLMTHPWHTHDTLMTHPWHTHDTLMTHPWHSWHTHDTLMTHSWHTHDTPGHWHTLHTHTDYRMCHSPDDNDTSQCYTNSDWHQDQWWDLFPSVAGILLIAQVPKRAITHLICIFFTFHLFISAPS